MVTTFANAKGTVESTPSLVIDLPTVNRNLEKLQRYAGEHKFKVRPHTKTHKSRYMSHLQMEAGACGLTVAKVGEAESLLPEAGDFLVAYPAIDSARTKRLAKLAGEKTIRVAVDSIEGVEALAAAARTAGTTIGILVDQDIGFHRTGLQSAQATLELAQRVESLQPALRLDGIFIYPGHVWAPAAEQGPAMQAIDDLLEETLDLWARSGLSAGIVSGGSTPSLYQSHLITRQTEVRPGTYIYNDMNTMRAGFCTLEEVATALICTVVSQSVPGKAIVDGGTKTFTSDRNVRFPDSGFGLILEYPEAQLQRMSEEHGELDLSRCKSFPKVGERVTIVPNHICPCVNLQDHAFLQHADNSLESLNIDSRGRLS